MAIYIIMIISLIMRNKMNVKATFLKIIYWQQITLTLTAVSLLSRRLRTFLSINLERGFVLAIQNKEM